jgi:hypothetical protein
MNQTSKLIQNKLPRLVDLQEIERKLGITQPTDWYKFGYREVIKNGGRSLLYNFGNSLSRMLASLYPEVNWEISRYNIIQH